MAAIHGARGLRPLGSGISDLLKELSTESKRKGGLHAAADGRQLLCPVAEGPYIAAPWRLCQERKRASGGLRHEESMKRG